ncbi:MAG: glucokinase [Chloroflexota bacterium]|nr:MAG: glucokinase [Chloroflexota bacterium]
MSVLAVDIGGTKVAVAAVARDGRILRKTHQPTDLRGYAEVVNQIVTMSRAVLDGEAIFAVGLSAPAVIDRATERILWAPNLPGWEDIDLKGLVSARFGVPASIEYDGHAAALGEWWGGAGRGCQSLASIVIGTGIGAGFIEEGRLWRGYNRLAGAVGWFPIHTEDGIVSWEQAASGAGIVRAARRRIERGAPTCLQPDGLTAKQVFAAARQQDALACQVMEETARYIGLGVASVISFANPQVVVLGGSIGRHSDLILPSVRQIAAEWAQPYAARDVLIVPSTLGEEAGLLGAAYSAFEQFERQ